MERHRRDTREFGGPLAVAVVGAGIAGLGAAHALSRRHRVELFERDARAGGHAHTHVVEHAGRTWDVDTGFLVYNHATYPNFVRLLAELGVAGRPSDMSFGVQCRPCGIAYSSRGLRGVFARRRQLASPQHLAMLRDIPRFNRAAHACLAAGPSDRSLGHFLGATRPALSDGFVRHYLLPMIGAIWSAPSGDVRAFPAEGLFRFMRNHGLLALAGAPRWWTVAGGSRRYVDAITSRLGEAVHLGTAVETIMRHEDGVSLRVHGSWRRFDRVVIATHADQALRMLGDPSPRERETLGLDSLDRVRDLGFDDRFVRTWDFYLSICQVLFRMRQLTNLQLVLTRPGNRALAGIPTERRSVACA